MMSNDSCINIKRRNIVESINKTLTELATDNLILRDKVERLEYRIAYMESKFDTLALCLKELEQDVDYNRSSVYQKLDYLENDITELKINR